MIEKKKEYIEEKLKGYFKKTLEAGHLCLFTGKMVNMKDILKDEKQFRTCVWCRLNNLVIAYSALKKRLERIEVKEEKKKDEETPSYIA